jgi:hypothetical protein
LILFIVIVMVIRRRRRSQQEHGQQGMQLVKKVRCSFFASFLPCSLLFFHSGLRSAV